MRFSIGIALIGIVLAGCAGPAGNPNGQPYAGEPGGTMAVKPQFIGEDVYNPYDKSAAMPTPSPYVTPPPPR